MANSFHSKDRQEHRHANGVDALQRTDRQTGKQSYRRAAAKSEEIRSIVKLRSF